MAVIRRRNNINYSGVAQEEVDGFSVEQFQPPPKRFPWKTIIFVVVFLIGGLTCLTFAALIGMGYFGNTYEDRIGPLLILSTIMLIPGGYYGFVLLCICLHVEGYSLDQIPIN